ncbi:Tripartite tricarboxylate transporter family receptor [Pigmentiphaga humi]|uniref:Tripartite tricarboxylate transporter family receptor n=1 Tax=Pigmentiphaga humi TaxID=2478468 RepID=A0A3P4B6I0_9BURK|nr:tripartite tricarboxylate transporter substrate-binding protein [Pigmentiphaga humi]VCU71904.1 Tripartite tricarboxylate transporter family receptor [Pigmentiphaga humi]
MSKIPSLFSRHSYAALAGASRTVRFAAALMCAAALAASLPAQAQSYPAKPVRLVVPYPPGAGVDQVGRLIAEGLGERWNQQVIVDNRAGASGLIGAEYVARSPADGYSVLIMPLDIAINPAVLDGNRYDPAQNLTPVASLANSTQIVATAAGSGLSSFGEAAKRAQAEPGKLAFGSCGNGSPGQIVGLQLKTEASTEMLHVPYKGCANAVVDAAGGQIPLVIGGAGGITPQLRSGRLKALAVVSETRDPLFPDVPTLKELGYPVSFHHWFGLFVPNGTGSDVVSKIYADLERVYADPGFAKKLANLNLNPELQPGAEFKKRMTAEVDKYKTLLRQAGVKPE